MRPMPRRLILALVAGALLTVAVAVPAGAVEPIAGVPIPDEPPAIELAEVATGALAFDLDGDGVNELLGVVADDAAQGLLAVQAWWVADDGSVERSNQVRARRSASVDEILAGRGRLGIDRDDMIAVRVDEPARLVVVRRDGRDVVLLATMGTETDQDVQCCFTVWELTMAERGQIDLRLVADPQRIGVEFVPVDVDGDGTDELLVTEGPLTDGGGDLLDVSLLRWTGERFARDGFTIPLVASCCAAILDVGETDGQPGEEVLLTGPSPDLATGLHRVSSRDGVPHVERAEIGEVAAARAVDLPSGPAIVVADGFSSLYTWSWSSDQEPERLAFRTTGGAPVAVFGSGDESRVFVSPSVPPGSVLALPSDLGGGVGPTTTFGRDTRAGSFSAAFGGDTDFDPPPFFGVLPDGAPGAPNAYAFAGSWVAPDPDPEVVATATRMALLPGLEPLGRVGNDGEWMALLSNFGPVEFFGFPIVRPQLDMLRSREIGRLALVATASVFEPEADLGRLFPTWTGVAPDPGRPFNFIVGNDPVDAEIHAPPGTLVRWKTRGGGGVAEALPNGLVRIRLLEAAGTSAPDGSGTTASIALLTPAGHAYSGTWRISVYRQPPDLGIRDDPALIDFSPTLSGQTIPGSTLTVNGKQAPVAEDGSFAIPVDVGVLPTELRVVVVDPVGNRTERVVSRVWPFDYRKLPFVPIAVLLTIAAGAVLFLRKPDAGPRRRTPDDGSTFEEIGG
jgi:hypothetical protein